MIQIRLMLFVLSLLSGAVQPGAAQTAAETERMYAPVPFGPGERMTYKVRLGFVRQIGSGSIEVQTLDTIRGATAYQLRMHLEGGIPLAHVRDEYHSWLDVKDLYSHRFKTDVKEVRYKRKRTLDFFPLEKRWSWAERKETGTMPTDQPLDDLSFLYFFRTIKLEVGQTYTFNRYWKDEGNPVTVKVLRRDTAVVSAGRFPSIVVQPIIRTDGLFSEGGKAEVYFTDDDRRIPVLIKTSLDVPILKSLTMSLESYTPGNRLSAPFSPRSNNPQ